MSHHLVVRGWSTHGVHVRVWEHGSGRGWEQGGGGTGAGREDGGGLTHPLRRTLLSSVTVCMGQRTQYKTIHIHSHTLNKYRKVFQVLSNIHHVGYFQENTAHTYEYTTTKTYIASFAFLIASNCSAMFSLAFFLAMSALNRKAASVVMIIQRQRPHPWRVWAT